MERPLGIEVLGLGLPKEQRAYQDAETLRLWCVSCALNFLAVHKDTAQETIWEEANKHLLVHKTVFERKKP